MSVVSPSGAATVAVVLALTLFASYTLERRIEKAPAVLVPIERFPYSLGSWQGKDTKGLELRTREILGLSRFVRRYYESPDGRGVFIYIGYWDKQSGDRQAAKHSPQLCLPANGWITTRPELFRVEMPQSAGGSTLEASSLVGEIGNNTTVFVYWFFSGKTLYRLESRALAMITLSSLIEHRSDGGIVEVSVTLPPGVGDERALEEARATIKDFIKIAYPQLDRLIKAPESPSSFTESGTCASRLLAMFNRRGFSGWKDCTY